MLSLVAKNVVTDELVAESFGRGTAQTGAFIQEISTVSGKITHFLSGRAHREALVAMRDFLLQFKQGIVAGKGLAAVRGLNCEHIAIFTERSSAVLFNNPVRRKDSF